MPITARDRTEDGQLVGWDSDQKKWIALDEQAEQGSFLGNVGRAAGREFQSIGQGVQDLLVQPDELQQLQGEQLRQRQEAAQRAAPWASMIGSAAPDVAAGLAIAPFTGGMSVPAMLATEATAGALTGALRPGSVEARIGAAALGAAGSVGGLALGHVAAAGVGGALKVFGRLEGRTLELFGRQVDAAGERVRIARQPVEGEVMPPQRGVGAAETPQGEVRFPAEEAEQAGVYARGEQAGSGNANQAFERDLSEVTKEGYVPPIGQGTRLMSPERRYQALREYMPGGNILEDYHRAGNQAMLGRWAARAVGDPNWEKAQRIDVNFFGEQKAVLGETFQDIERRLPRIGVKEYKAALEDIRQTQGLFGKTEGQQIVMDAVKNAEQRLGQVKGKKFLSGEEIMADRSYLNERMATLYREQKTQSGETLMQAIDRLDKVIDVELKQNKYKKGLAEKWATARGQWRVLEMLQNGASASPTGDVNPRSLLNRMKRDPSSGGYGPAGPDRESAAGKLYTLVKVMADAESGVPHTGVRQLIAKGVRYGGGAAIGGGLFGGTGGLFGD